LLKRSIKSITLHLKSQFHYLMGVKISFNKLRTIKDTLPEGSLLDIAKKLNVDIDTVRNYFGATNYKKECCVGLHYQQGPDGGIIELDDPTILNMALAILKSNK